MKFIGRQEELRFYHERQTKLLPDGQVQFLKGGKTTVALVIPSEQKDVPPTILFVAEARCHHRDVFSRRIGRREAVRRLLQQLDAQMMGTEQGELREDLKALRRAVGLGTFDLRML